MKVLLILVALSLGLAMRSQRLGSKRLVELTGVVGLVVAWQCFSIVFRHIGVD